MGVTALIALGLELLPKLIAAGMDIGKLIGTMKRVNDSQEVTDADWAELHAMEAKLRDRLHSDER